MDDLFSKLAVVFLFESWLVTGFSSLHLVIYGGFNFKKSLLFLLLESWLVTGLSSLNLVIYGGFDFKNSLLFILLQSWVVTGLSLLHLVIDGGFNFKNSVLFFYFKVEWQLVFHCCIWWFMEDLISKTRCCFFITKLSGNCSFIFASGNWWRI